MNLCIRYMTPQPSFQVLAQFVQTFVRQLGKSFRKIIEPVNDKMIFVPCSTVVYRVSCNMKGPKKIVNIVDGWYDRPSEFLTSWYTKFLRYNEYEEFECINNYFLIYRHNEISFRFYFHYNVMLQADYQNCIPTLLWKATKPCTC